MSYLRIAGAAAMAMMLGAVVSCASWHQEGANDRLFHASQTGDVEEARSALADGADPLAKSEHDLRTTPLDMAQDNRYTRIVELMKASLLAKQETERGE